MKNLIHKHTLEQLLVEKALNEDVFTDKLRAHEKATAETGVGLPGDAPFGALSRDNSQLVSDALKEIESAEFASKERRKGVVLKDTLEEFPKLFPPYAFMKIVADAHKGVKTINDGITPDEIVMSNINDYAILDKFDIHPAFFVLLDDHVLGTLETSFLQKINAMVQNNNKITVGELPDINLHIENYINKTFPEIEIKIKNRS